MDKVKDDEDDMSDLEQCPAISGREVSVQYLC